MPTEQPVDGRCLGKRGLRLRSVLLVGHSRLLLAAFVADPDVCAASLVSEQAHLSGKRFRGASAVFSAVYRFRDLRAYGGRVELHASAHVLAVARYEIACSFISDAKFAELIFAQTIGSARANDKACPSRADTRHAQEQFERGGVHFNGEDVQVIDSPPGLRVEVKLEVGCILTDDFRHVELVEAQ